MKLLTRSEHLYSVSTRTVSCSSQHTGLPTAQKLLHYQVLPFNQLRDLLDQGQLNLVNVELGKSLN